MLAPPAAMRIAQGHAGAWGSFLTRCTTHVRLVPFLHRISLRKGQAMGLRAAPVYSGRAFGLKCLLSEERPPHLVSFCALSTQRCLDPVHAARQGASGDAGDSRFASAGLA